MQFDIVPQFSTTHFVKKKINKKKQSVGLHSYTNNHASKCKTDYWDEAAHMDMSKRFTKGKEQPLVQLFYDRNGSLNENVNQSKGSKTPIILLKLHVKWIDGTLCNLM